MKIHQIDAVRSSLNELLNRKVVYGVSEFSIIDFKYDGRISKFLVKVDDRDEEFELTVDAAVDFVRECRLVNSSTIQVQSSTVAPAAAKVMVTPNLQTTNTLKNILLENINKIKDNPNYIPQAQEISKQVGQVINVLRTEMECLRLAKMLTGEELGEAKT